LRGFRTVSRLRSLFRFPRPHESCAFFDRGDDLHRVPIVGQFLAAIQANNIGAGKACRTAAASGGTRGDGKTVMRMPAAEDRIEQLCEHTTSTAALLSALNETLPESPSCHRKLSLGHSETRRRSSSPACGAKKRSDGDRVKSVRHRRPLPKVEQNRRIKGTSRNTRKEEINCLSIWWFSQPDFGAFQGSRKSNPSAHRNASRESDGDEPRPC
jgi:hypothetical protein